MIQLCLNHITECLTAIGILKVYVDDENINDHKGYTYGGVMTGDGTLKKDGSRVGKEDDLNSMTRTYRCRRYEQVQPFQVLLVDKDKSLVEVHLTGFLTRLGSFIKDEDNNPIDIQVTDVSWMEERSKLNKRAGAEISLTFTGGIYQDRTVHLVDLETALSLETELGGAADG